MGFYEVVPLVVIGVLVVCFVVLFGCVVWLSNRLVSILRKEM